MSATPEPTSNRLVAEQTLALAVPTELVEVIARRAAELVADRVASSEPDGWLDVQGAAEYLSCKPKRIYDLKSQGRIRCVKDGSRPLFRRSWLDAYLLEETS